MPTNRQKHDDRPTQPVVPNFDEEHNTLARKLYRLHTFNDLLALKDKLNYQEYTKLQQQYQQHESSEKHIALVQLIKDACQPMTLAECAITSSKEHFRSKTAAHAAAISHQVAELGREFTASGIEMALALNASAALNLSPIADNLSYCGIGLTALPMFFIPFKCLVAVSNHEEVKISKEELQELANSALNTALFVAQLLVPPVLLVRRGYELIKSAVELYQFCRQRHHLQQKLIPLRQEYQSTSEVLKVKLAKLHSRQQELEQLKGRLMTSEVPQDTSPTQTASESIKKSLALTDTVNDFAKRVMRLKAKVNMLQLEKQQLAKKINHIEHKLETTYSRANLVKKVLAVNASALALAGGCVALLCANPITGPVVGTALVLAACAIFAGILIHKIYERYQHKQDPAAKSTQQSFATEHPG